MKRRGRGSAGKRMRGERYPQRPSRYRVEKTRILIVCEGRETEPNYFHGLREEEVSQNFIVEVRKGKGGSCLAVVQQAIAENEKAAARLKYFDEVWCVCDVERAGHREQIREAREYAERSDLQLVLSNPSFECWFLAHFIRTKRSFADGDKVIQELNRHWRREIR